MRLKKRRAPGDPSRAVVYLRVSTTMESQDAGLVSQREACERWAASRGLAIIAQHQDRLSGVTPADERPGLMAALEDIRQHNAGVPLVAHRSRIAHDVVVAAIIERLARDPWGESGIS